MFLSDLGILDFGSDNPGIAKSLGQTTQSFDAQGSVQELNLQKVL